MNNVSGIHPVLDKILVKPMVLPKKVGMIEMPDTVLDTHMEAQMEGILVAVGPDSWSDYCGPAAVVGDRVSFARYGGQRMWGVDGEQYRLLYDRDISAKLDEGVSFTELQARKPMAKQGAK
jgi:co-chaperonin GroES (HSP10)